jgi:O-antigen ligase
MSGIRKLVLGPRAQSALIILTSILCVFVVGRYTEWVPGLNRVPFAKALLPAGAFLVLTRPDLRRRLGALESPQAKALGALLVVIMLSIPTSYWPGQSMGGLADFLLAAVPVVLLFAVAGSSLSELTWILRSYVVALITLAVALKTGFAQPDPDGRVYISTTYDANDLALVAIVGLALSFALLREKSRVSKALGAMGVAGALVTVATSGSRGGFLGLAAVIVVGLFGFRRALPRWGKVLLIPALCVGGVLAPSSFWGRISTLTHLNDDYNVNGEVGRVAVWKRGLSYWADQPLTGIGFQAYTTAEGRWAETHRSEGDRGFKYSVAHNSFVEVLAELGTLGFIAWLGMFVPTFTAARKARRLVSLGRAPPALLAMGHTLSLAIVGFFVAGFFVSAAYGIVATVLAGFGMAYSGIVRQAAR